ncbi:MAG: hypothetical protein JRI59_06385 [Deltaproteobacteria bacterium]|nr:hypothetical protein [Deltaproteobacteria bacterium]MBW1991731.1 hypothetical protein [Deltaproteobacteria bacterium]
MAELQETAGKLIFSRITARRVIATLAALYLLRTRFADREAEWRLTAAKAEAWLKAKGLTLPPPGPDFKAWLEEVLAKV